MTSYTKLKVVKKCALLLHPARPMHVKNCCDDKMKIVLLVSAAVGLLKAFAEAGDINRQSIVYHEETPQVFYCPQEKPVSLEGMIVKARPLKALCEHQGRALPDNYMSDCWNDVDETEFACRLVISSKDGMS